MDIRDEISHPDFFLNDFDVYIEYWGLVNALDSRVRDEYTRVMKWKMAQYHENNIRFISIYPSNLDNLDGIFKAKLREITGVDFLTKLDGIDNVPKQQHFAGLDAKVKHDLGRYIEKIHVSNLNDGDQKGIKVRPKGWLKKEEWADINDILKLHQFRWQSNGKDSFWIK